MRKINVVLGFVLCFMLACTFAPEEYIINGTVDEKDFDGKVFLFSSTFDTLQVANVIDGKYEFKGQVDQPTMAKIMIGHNSFDLILENDSYQVIVNEFVKYAKGGKINTLVYGYNSDENFIAYRKDYKEAVLKEFTGLDMMDEVAVDNARKKVNAKQSVYFKLIKNFQNNVLDGDFPAIAKLFVLSTHYDWKNYDINRSLELLNEYEKELGSNDFLNQLRQRYLDEIKAEEKRKAVAPGKVFKDVFAMGIDDKEVKLSDIVSKNEYTLFEMWASWCGPCRGEFPHLKKAYSVYHEKGFEIYALSFDENKKQWLKALEQEDVPWINVVDFKGFESSAAQQYSVQGIPASFLISKEGIIVATGDDIRGFALDDKLKELLD
ncbi:AhpC/TSA family protein [Ancylomarina euxinus]|uniref:AhpC/TSA family protein n=1 Tax=Ancylomarina euxinus TaxID=2283627 RepID=A0A425XZ21_9BACT|nr:TlpA disulfide reductase family protein [Ancylomarina euxinus]MCZ4695592.1 TlpA disulfide reductase family protein [Ancylomarina euxinus]MUP15973.1 redoxin domain-containing protein [Ancylomarina euxinus]RRG20415.1 AhpC/TSA family protein [Ancylomarina euxinus]